MTTKSMWNIFHATRGADTRAIAASTACWMHAAKMNFVISWLSFIGLCEVIAATCAGSAVFAGAPAIADEHERSTVVAQL